MSKSHVKLSNLSVDISGNKILDSISLDIEEGISFGVFGESGSGKSTLARYLANQLTPLAHARTQVTEVKEKVALVHQNPLLSLNPVLTIRDQLEEAISAGSLSPLTQDELAIALSEAGISQARARLADYPMNFSGGELQRIAVVRAILYRPELLILDEATSALDEQNQELVFDLIQSYQRETRATVLIISHSVELIQNHTAEALFLDKGQVVEQGKTQELISQPTSEKLKRLVAARTGFSQRSPRSNSGEALLKFDQLDVFSPDNPKGERLVRIANFQLLEGESLGITAPSGTGKSSFLKGLLGSYPARFRNLTVAGIKHKSSSLPNKVKNQYGYVLQDPRDSFDPLKTINASLKFALGPKARITNTQTLLAQSLKDVGLDPALGKRFPSELSGGQLQRASIARALVVDPKILFLDEPTSALDQENEVLILELLQSLREKYGLTILLISHSSFVTKAATDRVISL
jgi:ABC-type dipeptide/oligopeptide/nickel transport system ATPase subunit